METATTYNRLVIVLTEHPIFGTLLIPYTVEPAIEEGGLYLIEQAFHLTPKAIAALNTTEQKAIEIASHYTEKYLMGVYSKEKTLPKFLQRLNEAPEKIKNIRPFIEKKLREMIELIQTEGLPLYQKQSRSKLLYPYHRYNVNRRDGTVEFSFAVDNDEFSYQIKCYYEGKLLNMTEHKPVVPLTTDPATLIMGMNIYTFKQIESFRLLPFTKKTCISVDVSLADKYIDNILIPMTVYHDFSAEGIDIHEETRTCESLLSIEDTVCATPLLALKFRYGDDLTFEPDSSGEIKRVVFKNNDKGAKRIHYFNRRKEIEAESIQFLLGNGLKRVSDSHFELSKDASERSVIEWFSNHRNNLQKQGFVLTSNIQNLPYCTDEICIEQHCEKGLDWFELNIIVMIGELRIPFSHFRKHILEGRKEFLLPNQQVMLLPEEWFSKYANLMEMGNVREKGINVKRPFIGIVHSILEENEKKLSPSTLSSQEYTPPSQLKANLRPYQQKGYFWLMNHYEQGFGACLADDMGLGKTLQTLALLQKVYNPDKEEEGVSKEEKEDNRWTNSDLSTMTVLPDEMGQFSLFGELSDDQTLPGNGKQWTEKVSFRKPGTLIVVPTSLLHNWKREAARFTALSMFEYTGNTRFMKGHPELLFSRYHLFFTSYGVLRNNIETLRQYCFEYVVLDESQNIKNSDSITFQAAIQLQSNHKLILTGTPIENSLKDLWAQFHFLQPDLLGNESEFNKRFMLPIKQGNSLMEARLKQLIQPFILRRSKKEVAPELPSLTEEFIYCDMTDEQREIYVLEKNRLRNSILELEASRRQHQQLTVLNGILRLRQLSCHPQLVLPEFGGTSGKLEQVIEQFETLQSEGHKVLIFSAFVKHLELISKEFDKRGWKYALLTGASTNRAEEITRFADSEDIHAFLISLKAGGVGLNLTQADYVFIIDPWWNPAAEAQAIARAHRIGQNRQVIAYRFITQDSIEEKIIRLQEEKRKLAETFINENESLPDLTDKEWIGLLD